MKALLVAVGALLLILSGCSSKDAAAGDTAQGITDSTIKIGTTLPLTGGAATAGEGFQAGLEAAIAEVNADGGIGGREVELTVLDDGFEAARSVANVRRLGDEEQVFAIVSPAGSANLPGSWTYIEEKGLPVFAPVLPPDPGLEDVYLLGTSHENQARIIVDFLAEQGAKTVGVIGQDNDLGKAILDGVTEQAEVQGIEIVATETTEPNSTDVSSATLNLRDADPDAVVFGTDNTQTGLVIKQAAQLGWDPIFIGDSSTITTGTTGTTDTAGKAAEGAYGTLTVDLPTSEEEKVAAWRSVMEEHQPDFAGDAYALQAYASFQIFTEIVEGMDDPTWEAFAEQAESLDAFEVGILPPVTFGAPPDGRTGTVGAKVAQWTDGEWQVVSDWLEPQS